MTVSAIASCFRAVRPPRKFVRCLAPFQTIPLEGRGSPSHTLHLAPTPHQAFWMRIYVTPAPQNSSQVYATDRHVFVWTGLANKRLTGVSHGKQFSYLRRVI